MATSKTTTESGNKWAKVSSFRFLSFIGDIGDMRYCVHRETQVQRSVKVILKNKLSQEEKARQQEEYKCMKELVNLIHLLLTQTFRITPILRECTNSSKTKRDTISSLISARVVSYSMKSLPEVSFQRMTQLC